MSDWLLLYFPSSLIVYSLIAAATLAAFVLLFALKKSEWIVYVLLIWFPFESLILMYTPLDSFGYVKYIPELLFYGLVAGALVQYFQDKGRIAPRHPLIRWLYLIVICAALTLLARWYDPITWGLGLRQLLRFALLIFVCLWMRYDEAILKKIMWIGIGMIMIEACLGLVQYASGGALDRYVFSTETVTVGNRAVLEGLEQTWTPGTRIFATMGRYDRLGSLLALGIIMLFPWIYTIKDKTKKWWLILGIALLSVCLILTKSRASWIAAIVGLLATGWYLRRDKRVLIYGGIAVFLITFYLGIFALTRQNVLGITETRSQSLSERLIETISPHAWRQSYDGLGRIFFIINTPRIVVSEYPLLGVGPGRYGGGVAAALADTEVYDKLSMPFGIENRIGQIDNNWMSIWGEFGTLGLIAWIGLFMGIMKIARETAKRADSLFEKNIAEGTYGLAIGIMCIGFFGPYFEFRALMFYFWLVVGIVALLWYRIRKNMSFVSH